jgi:hypothetical protein
METGRKFWITVLGMLIASGLSWYAMWRGVSVPPAVIEALATMVVAFCGGNAAVSFGYAMAASKAVTDTTTRTVAARRAVHDDGTEDTL